MPSEIKRCFLGCCRFVDNRLVDQSDYERAFQNQVDILIACRNIPDGHHQRQVEDAAGFYLGSPFQRAYGTLLPAGAPFVYNNRTGERLRQARTEDIKKWNDEWKRRVAKANQKSNQH